jgi:hypothetical protein
MFMRPLQPSTYEAMLANSEASELANSRRHRCSARLPGISNVTANAFRRRKLGLGTGGVRRCWSDCVDGNNNGSSRLAAANGLRPPVSTSYGGSPRPPTES